MKKKICRIFGVAMFLAVGIFIFAQISELFRAKTASNKDMIHSLYKLEKDSIDVLVLGSSHGYSSIQPNTLWHEHGITSYVMCSPSQSVPSSYYALLEALKYQKPKVVLLEAFMMHYEKKYTMEPRLRQVFDGMRLGKVKLDALGDLLPSTDEMGFKERLTYYIPFIKYHSRWNDLRYYDFHTTNMYLKGSILNYKVFPVEDPGMTEETKEIPEIPLQYLQKIRQTCEENGIQLVLYSVPYSISDGNVEKYTTDMEVNNALEIYLAEEGIPFLNYNKIPEAGIDFSTDFRNATHMNTYGEVKVTRYLGTYLTQEFDMEDHREDPAYESWNRDYLRYKNAAGESADDI